MDQTQADRAETEARHRACAICGRVLDRYDEEGTDGGWFHAEMDEAAADHVAIPVGVDEIRTMFRCDFCMIDVPEPWVVPAKTFNITPQHRSDGDWASCETCAALITRGDWNRLAHRCTDAVLAESGEGLDRSKVFETMKTMHRMLRKNLVGLPRKKTA